MPEQTFAIPGIDVSSYQRSIDWVAVAHSGIKFAFIKATEGTLPADPWLARNWHGAASAAVAHGAYHFFHPQADPNQQAISFLNALQPLPPSTLPPVLDLEAPLEWAAIPRGQRVGRALTWLNRVESTLHVTPVIYLSPSFATDILPAPSESLTANDLARFPLWLAHYAPAPKVPLPWQNWTFWQHSDSGRVPGIAGNVDVNWCRGQRLPMIQNTSDSSALTTRQLTIGK